MTGVWRDIRGSSARSRRGGPTYRPHSRFGASGQTGWRRLSNASVFSCCPVEFTHYLSRELLLTRIDNVPSRAK
jgi:hypothetical protein